MYNFHVLSSTFYPYFMDSVALKVSLKQIKLYIKLYMVMVKKKQQQISRFWEKQLSILRKNREKKKTILGEISRRFAAK